MNGAARKFGYDELGTLTSLTGCRAGGATSPIEADDELLPFRVLFDATRLVVNVVVMLLATVSL